MTITRQENTITIHATREDMGDLLAERSIEVAKGELNGWETAVGATVTVAAISAMGVLIEVDLTVEVDRAAEKEYYGCHE